MHSSQVSAALIRKMGPVIEDWLSGQSPIFRNIGEDVAWQVFIVTSYLDRIRDFGNTRYHQSVASRHVTRWW